MKIQFFKKPWTLCTDLTTVIILCGIIIRVLSIWYVVGGFILKFGEPLLSVDGIAFLNNVFLGSLPLGSFVNALVLSLVPSIIIHTINAAITFFGFCRKMKGCLVASAAINILMIGFHFLTFVLMCWLLDEMNLSIRRQLQQIFNLRLNKYVPEMSCCGFDIASTPCATAPASLPPCFDYIEGTLKAYGGSFAAVLFLNIVVSAIMVIGTEYLFRYEQLKSKQSQDPDLWNIIEKSEFNNDRNGMCAKINSFLKEGWERNPLASKFGYLSVLVLMLDGGIILTIIFVRYNFYDMTMSEELSSIHAYGKIYINIGYLKDALLITFICLLIWSILAKVFYFAGTYLSRKCLLATFICSEILVLAVECIIFGLSSYLLRVLYCCDWNRTALDSCPFSYGSTTPLPICDRSWTNAAKFIWFSILVLVVRIFLKVFCIAGADNVYKHLKTKAGISESNIVDKKCGFFYSVYLSSRRNPLTAAVVAVSILICIVNCVYFCGLIVVRYGKSSYGLLTDSLHAVHLGSLDMSSNRDNAILISVVSLSLAFFLQYGKFVSIGLKRAKVTLLILWSELPLLILHLCSAAMSSILLKLVHCCSDDTDCSFLVNGVNSPIPSTEFCVSNTLDHADLQLRLMVGFGILSIILQILSIVLGYVHFKRSKDGKLGIFKGVSELFKSIWCDIKKTRIMRISTRITKVIWEKVNGKLTKYTTLQRIFFSLQILILILNILFGIGLFRVTIYPGYMWNDDILSSVSGVKLSFGFVKIGTVVTGIRFSLYMVVPTTSLLQLLGILSLIGRARDLFKITCEPLFLEPVGVLVAYVVGSFIIHISVSILSIKILRQLHSRVGIIIQKNTPVHQHLQQNPVAHENNTTESESLPQNMSELREGKIEGAIDENILGSGDSSTENVQDIEKNQTDNAQTLRKEEYKNFEMLSMDNEKTERKEHSSNIAGDVQNVETGYKNQASEHEKNRMFDLFERNGSNDQKGTDNKIETVEKNETSGEDGGETDSTNVTEDGEEMKGEKKRDKKLKERQGNEHDINQIFDMDSASKDEDRTDRLEIEDQLSPSVENSPQDAWN